MSGEQEPGCPLHQEVAHLRTLVRFLLQNANTHTKARLHDAFQYRDNPDLTDALRDLELYPWDFDIR